MTLIRIELISLESEVEIKIDDRVFKVKGGGHVNVELAKVDEVATLRLTRAAAGADKYRGVPLEDPEMRMAPRPESAYAGVSTVDKNGQETYIGRSVQTKKKKKGTKFLQKW